MISHRQTVSQQTWLKDKILEKVWHTQRSGVERKNGNDNSK